MQSQGNNNVQDLINDINNTVLSQQPTQQVQQQPTQPQISQQPTQQVQQQVQQQPTQQVQQSQPQQVSPSTWTPQQQQPTQQVQQSQQITQPQISQPTNSITYTPIVHNKVTIESIKRNYFTGGGTGNTFPRGSTNDLYAYLCNKIKIRSKDRPQLQQRITEFDNQFTNHTGVSLFDVVPYTVDNPFANANITLMSTNNAYTASWDFKVSLSGKSYSLSFLDSVALMKHPTENDLQGPGKDGSTDYLKAGITLGYTTESDVFNTIINNEIADGYKCSDVFGSSIPRNRYLVDHGLCYIIPLFMATLDQTATMDEISQPIKSKAVGRKYDGGAITDMKNYVKLGSMYLNKYQSRELATNIKYYRKDDNDFSYTMIDFYQLMKDPRGVKSWIVIPQYGLRIRKRDDSLKLSYVVKQLTVLNCCMDYMPANNSINPSDSAIHDAIAFSLTRGLDNVADVASKASSSILDALYQRARQNSKQVDSGSNNKPSSNAWQSQQYNQQPPPPQQQWQQWQQPPPQQQQWQQPPPQQYNQPPPQQYNQPPPQQYNQPPPQQQWQQPPPQQQQWQQPPPQQQQWQQPPQQQGSQ